MFESLRAGQICVRWIDEFIGDTCERTDRRSVLRCGWSVAAPLAKAGFDLLPGHSKHAHSFAVRHDLPLPKYHRVYLVLREQLEEGRFASGVPGEMHLMKEFGVARVTMRKARERLVADGLIERAPGRGTVAMQRRGACGKHGDLGGGRFNGLLKNIVDLGLRTLAAPGAARGVSGNGVCAASSAPARR